MPSTQKSRRYTRVSLPKGTPVAWEHAGKRKVSSVRVLALGGLFIATATPPPKGDFITLVFEVPGGSVRARALVCDSQAGKGMGIEFKTMGQDARARLSRLMNTLTRV
ncbi:MAG TPA: PilZ domain-containing protein [Candidatus Acidoferrales bacterium]|nr:PilZ domain-containing protein [Candidatus Acidoferrales bacterium]